MLGSWRTHCEYVAFVLAELKDIAETDPERLIEYREVISKMLIFNVDNVKEIIEPLYSDIGRPALNQPEIFRSLVLQIGLKLSITDFHEKLIHNRVIRTIAGFTQDNVPGIGTFYDFTNRVYPINEKPALRAPYSKPKSFENIKLNNRLIFTKYSNKYVIKWKG